jgi:hypothetical protein
LYYRGFLPIDDETFQQLVVLNFHFGIGSKAVSKNNFNFFQKSFRLNDCLRLPRVEWRHENGSRFGRDARKNGCIAPDGVSRKTG